jgi:hypothetical protein
MVSGANVCHKEKLFIAFEQLRLSRLTFVLLAVLGNTEEDSV